MSNDKKHIAREDFLNRLFDKSGFRRDTQFESEFEKEAAEGYELYNSKLKASEYLEGIDSIITGKAGIKPKKQSITRYIFPIASIAATLAIFIGVFTFLFTNVFNGEEKLAQNLKEEVATSDYEWKSQTIEQEEVYIETLNDSNSIISKADSSLDEEKIELPLIAMNNSTEEEVDFKRNKELKKKSPREDNYEYLIESSEPASGNTFGGNRSEFELSEEKNNTDLDEISIMDAVETPSDNQNLEYFSTPSAAKSFNKESRNLSSSESYTLDQNNQIGGMELYNSGKYDEAITTLKNEGASMQNAYYIGMSYYNLGKFNKAINQFDEVIGNNGSFTSNAKWFKAQILLNKGKKNDAKALLKDLASKSNIFQERAINVLNGLD